MEGGEAANAQAEGATSFSRRESDRGEDVGGLGLTRVAGRATGDRQVRERGDEVEAF